MEHYGVPAVSVAFVEGGELAWAQAWGLADVETGRQATTETLFQAASISKPVAAVAAAGLVEEGLLTLDGDVNETLQTWKIPAHELGGAVTLRRLLSHTAGLTVHGFPGYGPEETVPSTAGVLAGEGNTAAVMVDLMPGSQFRYSGGGYTVAQLMMEEATGALFAEVMRTNVLEPLGMSHSTFRQPLPLDLRDQAATAYRRNGEAVEGAFHTYPEMAAAGLWTTPSDLALFLLGMQKALAGGGQSLLSQESARNMVMPVKGNYGLGFGISEELGTFGHGGANEGYRCFMTASIEGGQGAVIMTNSDTGRGLANEILLTLVGRYGLPGPKPETRALYELSTEELSAIAGTYRMEKNAEAGGREPEVLRLVVEVDHLRAYSSWDASREWELLPETRESLFTRNGELTVAIHWKDDSASVSSLEAGGDTYWPMN